MEWRRGGEQTIDSAKLPDDLAATLAPRTQKALDHPLRRRILRILSESEEPRSAGELVGAAAPDVSQSVVSYHAQVLEGCGCICAVDAEQVAGGIAPRYAMATDDPQITTVLQATLYLDRS